MKFDKNSFSENSEHPVAYCFFSKKFKKRYLDLLKKHFVKVLVTVYNICIFLMFTIKIFIGFV